MSDKKKKQLGMNPSTAQQRLVKDLLWDFVVKTGQGNCCKCGKAMSRETFSIEHIIPWLDTHDPVGLFFDINNISYSHLSCNISDAASKQRKHQTKEAAKEAHLVGARKWKSENRVYDPVKRKERYERLGT